MYLQGIITVDPSDMTHLVRATPTRAFARMAHLLSAGLSTPKEEQETFTAVAILQQINAVMRSLGIDSIVRLAKDDLVFYEDPQGREGDLKKAIDEFAARVSSEGSGPFDTLSLTLEHHTPDLACLLEIRIRRTHAVGEYPIRIAINGLSKMMRLEQDEKQLRKKMQSLFRSQQKHDSFVRKHRKSFDTFLERMEDAFRTYMQVDNVRRTSSVKIVRPDKRVRRTGDVPRRCDGDDVYDPVLEEYPSFEDSLFYIWLWAESCYAEDIQCSDCTIVDASGAELMEIGEEGLQAGASDALNVDVPFAGPESHDLPAVEGGEEVKAEIGADSRSSFQGMDTGESKSGSWLSSLMDSFGGDLFGGDSGDGASCGGGCGSCGGGE